MDTSLYPGPGFKHKYPEDSIEDRVDDLINDEAKIHLSILSGG